MKIKVDLIIEAAHFKPDGYIDKVRAYVRWGPTFSDCVLVSRSQLIQDIQKGKEVATGQRIPRLASTFIDLKPLGLYTKANREFVTAKGLSTDWDYLNDIPTL